MSKVFYEKIDDQYVPVSEYDSDFIDSIPNGTHIIHKADGSQSRRYNIEPEYAPMLAVLFECRDQMCDAIYAASVARPSRKPISPQEQAAWKQLQEVADIHYIQYPAAYDIAERFIMVLNDKVSEIMQNPAVKEAYDHFQLMVKLAENDTK